MPPNDVVGRTANSSANKAAEDEKEGRRRLGSGLIVAISAFIVAYAIFAVSFVHWGPALGWLPSTVIAAAFGWIGYCLPWLGDIMMFLCELLSLFA